MKHGLTPPVCLPFVHLTSLHVTRSPRPSPAVFAYCKRSNTGGGNGLGTRLDIFYDHVCKPWIRYICSNLLEYVRQSHESTKDYRLNSKSLGGVDGANALPGPAI